MKYFPSSPTILNVALALFVTILSDSSTIAEETHGPTADQYRPISDVFQPLPYFVNGALRGYRIYAGADPEELFGELGLEIGDLIVEIDGQRLTDSERAFELLKEIGSVHPVQVKLERKGQLREIEIPALEVAGNGQSPPPGTSLDSRNAATFVSDVSIPDGTVMIPGQSFTKTWKFRNSGTTTWTDYNLTFVGGMQMSAPSSDWVTMTTPGATVDISVLMTAPTNVGSHRGHWQMHTVGGDFFGERVFVLIQVESLTYEGREFEDWEADLNADLPAVREKATGALSHFGPRATSALIKTFRSDPDESVRAMAFGALTEITPLSNDAIRVFLGAATDPSPTISYVARFFIQEALPSRIGPETVPALVDAMGDANAMTREVAVKLLASLGPAANKAAPTLRELADHDPDPRVRQFATEALKKIQ